MARADWEASLESFKPSLPRTSSSGLAAVPDQHRFSSPGQGRLRSERQPETHSEAASGSEQSHAEAEPVPTPLSEIAFEGAHVVEFCELTSSNSRIQLENFVEQFRGKGLAPLIRCTFP